MIDMELRERKSPRLKDYDYSHPGAYFVTICTKDKQCILGEIVGEELEILYLLDFFRCGKRY